MHRNEDPNYTSKMPDAMTTKPESKHTPTPWQIDIDDIRGDQIIVNKASLIICQRLNKENAEFIRRAVNAYDKNQQTIQALLALLKETHEHDSTVEDETNRKCKTCRTIWNAQAEGE